MLTLNSSFLVKFYFSEIKYPMVYVVMEMGDTDLSRLLKTTSQEKQIPLTMILYYWTEMLTAVKHIHDNGKYLNVKKSFILLNSLYINNSISYKFFFRSNSF